MNTPVEWNEFMASIGYDRRPQQDELVALIAETLENRGYLLGRAGTGTGKSLASVIPSLAYAQRSYEPRPIIVSTATKALQGQYYLKDLPKMADHFTIPNGDNPLSGNYGKNRMRYSILKGKRNYICLDRLNAGMHQVPIPHEVIDRLRQLPQSDHGDISTLGLSRPQELALTISSDECPGANDCIWATTDKGEPLCYFEKAKKRAGESDVLVVNHALLAAHIKILAQTDGNINLLPQWSSLVIDECHKLTGYVQNALGWYMSLVRLLKWANDCLDGSGLEAFKNSARDLFTNVVQYDKSDKKNEQQIQQRETLSSSDTVRSIVEQVEDALDYWITQATNTRDNDDRKKARKTANLLSDLDVALNPDDRDNFWVEIDKQGNKILNYKPAESKVADFMGQRLWPISPAILLSATTPDPETLGLPKDTEEFDADSPFDYKNQARLYISTLDGSPPYDWHDRQLWEQRRHSEMLKLVAASDGRALLLFTSWADLNKAHEVLAPKFKNAGITVLKQDRDNESERDRLARLLKEDEQSVLFGTESFFEGIDIPGKSLQLVIISKLPFPAMVDNTRGGKLDFRKEMLPEMRMKLIQAAGRLIRSHEDKGVVAVLDCRLRTKPYGRNVLANISPFNEMSRAQNLQDAMDFLESLEEE